MFGSSGRVQVRIGFDPLICGFFGFGLFRIRVKKIVFKTQNFQADSGRIFKLTQFLTGLFVAIMDKKNSYWCWTREPFSVVTMHHNSSSVLIDHSECNVVDKFQSMDEDLMGP